MPTGLMPAAAVASVAPVASLVAMAPVVAGLLGRSSETKEHND